MKLKKMAAWSLAAVMVTSSFIGSSAEESNETTQVDPIEVSVAIWNAEDGLNDPEDPIYKKLVEKTGVKLVPQNITWDDSGQKIQLWATNGQLPDIFVGDYVGTSFFTNWVDQGVIRALPENMATLPIVFRTEMWYTVGIWLRKPVLQKNRRPMMNFGI